MCISAPLRGVWSLELVVWSRVRKQYFNPSVRDKMDKLHVGIKRKGQMT